MLKAALTLDNSTTKAVHPPTGPQAHRRRHRTAGALPAEGVGRENPNQAAPVSEFPGINAKRRGCGELWWRPGIRRGDCPLGTNLD
jgi:hypothetical protein